MRRNNKHTTRNFKNATKMPSFNLRMFISMIFKFGCFLGFWYQISQVSDVYFAYRTSSKIDKSLVSNKAFPTIVFCSLYLEAMGYNFNKVPYPVNEDLMSKYTVKEILETTPDASHFIRNCRLRNQTRTLKRFSGRECHSSFFRVTKSVYSELLCYSIQPSRQLKYYLPDVVSSLRYRYEIFTIDVNPDIANSAHVISVIGYTPDDEPNHDWPFNSRNYGRKHIKKSNVDVVIYMSKTSTSTDLLRYPYDTNCVDVDVEVCYESCLRHKIKQMNRVSWSDFISEPINMIVSGETDQLNSSMRRIIDKFTNKCNEMCKMHQACHIRFSTTRSELNETPFLDNTTVISFVTPTKADEIIRTVASLTLTEYIIYVSSIFGIWFGLAIVHLNPVKFFTRTHVGAVDNS